MSYLTKTFFSGFASSQGTKKFLDAAVKKGLNSLHFKKVEDIFLSSLGMGTYLGNLTNNDGDDIENAIYHSVKEGCINVIDTAINYRSMLSEKNIGKALQRLFDEKVVERDQLFISTKNGYITNDGEFPDTDIETYLKLMYMDKGLIQKNDISSSYHIMNPNYISKCIDTSLCNLGLKTIDLVYIHNSFESWYNLVEKSQFMNMLSKVFQVYEKFREEGKIRFYGMATWNCFTSTRNSTNYLSLDEVVDLAVEIGGKDHGFKFIQLPYNIYLREPVLLKNQDNKNKKNLSIIDSANDLGIHVFTSVPLYQGKLLKIALSDKNIDNLPSMSLKLLQFVRSTPGVIAPLIGQKKMKHVIENISIAKYPPLEKDAFHSLLNNIEKVF